MDLEQIIISAFCTLDVDLLNKLDANNIYTYQTKLEFIQHHKILFTKLKIEGHTKLKVLPSKCLYCHPEAKAYSFIDAFSGEFIIRYVFLQESSDFYRIEECKNDPTKNNSDGLPF